VRYVKKALETDISLHRDPVGKTRRGIVVPGTLKDRWRALEKERLSLWKLYEGNLEGGFLYKGPCGLFKRKALETGISLHTDSVRNLIGGSFIGDFDRLTKEDSVNGASLSMGVLGVKIRGTSSLIGNLRATRDA
jgi:hypothetical protein